MILKTPRQQMRSLTWLGKRPIHRELCFDQNQKLTSPRYDGYNQDMIERFCSMGFQSSRVVSAFQALGMDRMGGEEYELDEPTMANIIGHLLGE